VTRRLPPRETLGARMLETLGPLTPREAADLNTFCDHVRARATAYDEGRERERFVSWWERVNGYHAISMGDWNGRDVALAWSAWQARAKL
jgi:hypothetical protein